MSRYPQPTHWPLSADDTDRLLAIVRRAKRGAARSVAVGFYDFRGMIAADMDGWERDEADANADD